MTHIEARGHRRDNFDEQLGKDHGSVARDEVPPEGLSRTAHRGNRARTTRWLLV